jgi:predicted RNA-binding Zn-ribbon protein involved in translation (DUF1610 family)
MQEFLCPKCGKLLKRVRQSAYSMLNRDQFDSVKAGDYYCDSCKGERGKDGMRYFWKHELWDTVRRGKG